MKHVIIGTAGHVDHGKTCLIKALTGIDTDRLKEEKKRGITIELGFAYLDFSEGYRVGIVDVPGHEKFVKNMLAGAGGIDVAMLIIAADEGVMPQTIEHLDILNILGIKKGLIVLTKTDLVEPEFLELVTEDIRELTEGSFLENAPIIPVSVFENQGIDILKKNLREICDSVPEPAELGAFRLPVDRVFSMKGFGTVVTGTLLDGKIKKEQEAMLYPEEISVKLRNIQVHGSYRKDAFLGERVAVNIPDRKKTEINRGDVLAAKNSLFPGYMLDVRLEALKHSERNIENGIRVHFYSGTGETLGKIVLIDQERLLPGESGYAQIRLEQKVAVKRGDHFVVRFYSPVETIGGGVVLDACPFHKKRRDQKSARTFQIKEKGTLKERLELAIFESWGCFCPFPELIQRSGLYSSTIYKDAEELCNEKRIYDVGKKHYIHRDELNYYRQKTEKFLQQFHKQFPLKEGMGIEETRSRLGFPDNETADNILAILEKQKAIKIKNGIVSVWKFKVLIKEDEDAMIQEIISDYLEAGYAPKTTNVYMKEHNEKKKYPAVFTSLLNKRILIRLDGQYCIHKQYYIKAKEVFKNMAETQKTVSLGEYRDMLGCSRKIAVAILEHFDKNGYTRKTEEGRMLKE